ncbi:RNA polymerase sigma factor region1.1 domain-containing protein [Bosea sp. LjRoot90]|uniref:RNA polymerase sigma factor region1.1 domain-containing protein n=1 Tax=Bosea sp. LjRoot90 TaxID=3342342 RepID=UPI003F50D181
MPVSHAWCDGLGPEFHTAVTGAERRGQMTYSEFNAVIPSEEYTSAQIEIVSGWLSDRGIHMVENEA